MSQNNSYDVPVTFVNVKRVKQEQDSKGRDRTVLTFGNYVDKNGTERNSLNELIEALLQLQDKQANLDVRIEMKTTDRGAQFPSAFVRVVEMIPKTQGQTQFVPKTGTNRAQSVKARAAKIQQDFGG